MRARRVQGRTITYYKSLYSIVQLTGHLIEINVKETKQNNQLDFSWINKINAIKHRKNKPIPKVKTYNENILECFSYNTNYLDQWISKGITLETLGRFEIGFSIPQNAITIQNRDWGTNELIGVRGRYILDEEVKQFGKYRPLYIEGEWLKHSLGSTFYSLNITKNRIKELSKVLVLEAEKSCLLNYSYFGEDNCCVALCGSNFTQTQKKIWFVGSFL